MNLPDFSSARRNKSVCVISDDHSADNNIGAVLNSKGHVVLEAHNASHALMIVEQSTPDILVIDAELPDSEERFLLSAVRSRFPSVHVLLSKGDKRAECSALIGKYEGGANAILTAGRAMIDLLKDVNAARTEADALNEYV